MQTVNVHIASSYMDLLSRGKTCKLVMCTQFLQIYEFAFIWSNCCSITFSQNLEKYKVKKLVACITAPLMYQKKLTPC